MRSFGFSLDLFLEVSPQNSFNPKGWVRNGGVSVRYLLVLLHRAGRERNINCFMSGAPSEPDTLGDTEQEQLSANSKRKRRGRNSGRTQVLDCARNQIPAVTEQRHCLVYIFIAKNCPE